MRKGLIGLFHLSGRFPLLFAYKRHGRKLRPLQYGLMLFPCLDNVERDPPSFFFFFKIGVLASFSFPVFFRAGKKIGFLPAFFPLPIANFKMKGRSVPV